MYDRNRFIEYVVEILVFTQSFQMKNNNTEIASECRLKFHTIFPNRASLIHCNYLHIEYQ